ncbi:hypothetical protein [Brevundimonas faecalis]|uniref:Flagellar assembly protein FliH n=1 Tax=Brevundimonas faecalis TaxID=947378 RepID=A0ABV2R7K7_9CAUL
MSRVLGTAVKGLGRVTPFTTAAAPSERDLSPMDAADAEIGRLNHALTDALAELQALKADVADAPQRLVEAERKAHAQGLEQGREQGLAEAATREAEGLALLASAAEDAGRRFQAALQALEPLAADLAFAALERITGDADLQSGLVWNSIRHNLALLDTGSGVRITVSGADFPDAEALKDLARLHDVEILADAGLPRGACRIRPDLGELHLDIPDQVARIRQAVAHALDGAE